MKKFIVSTMTAAAALLAMAGPASAHHPTVSATATCTEVTVTATSWQTDDPARMVNLDVRVLVDDEQVAAGEFTEANGHRFVVKTPATAGQHTVRVVARAPWGPSGEFGSAFEARAAVVSVPVCPEYAPRPTTPVRPPVVEIVQADIGTPNVVERTPVVVAGEQLEQPVRLAITGVATWQKVLAGVGLVVAGLGAVLAAKVARSKAVSAV
jgi:hypothetical protein